MSDHQYILEPYKGMNTRYHCPSCQQRDKTFSLYIDTETGKHIHPTVGRCSRESNCGHHYTPKQYFQDNNISFDTSHPQTYKPRLVTHKPVSFIPFNIFEASLNNAAFETNHFVNFLITLFGVDVTNDLVSRYFIATSKHWEGATVFWQIDTQGKIRTGKIMLYSPITGKRVKEPFNHIHWVHKAIKHPEFELRQCLFGEHLLNDKTKPVAIVESEKTAVIASVYFPQFIWVAVGSLNNLNDQKCCILKGRTAILYPDLNGFEKWNSKAKELSHLAMFTVSDLLERKANEAERKQGFDIADYLIKYDYKDFIKHDPIEQPTVDQPLIKVTRIEQAQQPVCNFIKPGQPKQENWEQDITELETYFSSIELPTQPVKLNSSTINNCSPFIESHITTVKANNGKLYFLPYLNRLKELKELLSKQANQKNNLLIT